MPRAVALILFVLIAGASGSAHSQGLYTMTCAVDGEIDASKRQAVDSAALKFVQTLLGPSPATAYGLLSQTGKQGVPSERALAQVGAAIEQFKPKDIKIQDTYLLKLTGKSPGRVVCETDLSESSGWESMVAADVSEQAYVLASADAINNRMVFTVWLVPEEGSWKVQSFSENMSTLADKGSEQLWELARAEKGKGHNFNARLLYAAAAQMTNRGPNFQMGLTEAISKEMSQLSVPPDLQGQPPFEWKTSEMTFRVLNVGPIAVGGKMYVMIQDESPPWSSETQIDTWNKALIAYFKHQFPEYSDVFAGVVVRANERGTNRGYGTVEQVNPPSN